ncbi:unnamed protein product [Nesidiocoris tenuis]|uniref:Rap-GAP domain-containing protein n=1 Tax=Nesidiocoris tenuis TaxID=355587 RepID=A0A6H5H3N6_9HEMI|nr:unnamed protein product [Nesidiocoris tenuis]
MGCITSKKDINDLHPNIFQQRNSEDQQSRELRTPTPSQSRPQSGAHLELASVTPTSTTTSSSNAGGIRHPSLPRVGGVVHNNPSRLNSVGSSNGCVSPSPPHTVNNNYSEFFPVEITDVSAEAVGATYMNVNCGADIIQEQEETPIYANLTPGSGEPLSYADIVPSTPVPAIRMVNYIVLDLNATSNDSSKTAPHPPESPSRLSQGYVTIDFDKTLALSNSANPNPNFDDECSRRTRHNSTIVTPGLISSEPQQNLIERIIQHSIGLIDDNMFSVTQIVEGCRIKYALLRPCSHHTIHPRCHSHGSPGRKVADGSPTSYHDSDVSRTDEQEDPRYQCVPGAPCHRHRSSPVQSGDLSVRERRFDKSGSGAIVVSRLAIAGSFVRPNISSGYRMSFLPEAAEPLGCRAARWAYRSAIVSACSCGRRSTPGTLSSVESAAALDVQPGGLIRAAFRPIKGRPSSIYALHLDHQNWFGMDDSLGPVAISLKKEKVERTNNSSSIFRYRLLVRTSELLTLRGSVMEDAIPNLKPSSSAKTINTKEVIEYCAPEVQIPCLRLGTSGSQTEDALLKLDEQGLSKLYKVGVMYCKAQQSTEEQMYNNQDAGPAFSEFLDSIGETVRLKGFDKYKAGLDNRTAAETAHRQRHSHHRVPRTWRSTFHTESDQISVPTCFHYRESCQSLFGQHSLQISCATRRCGHSSGAQWPCVVCRVTPRSPTR